LAAVLALYSTWPGSPGSRRKPDRGIREEKIAKIAGQSWVDQADPGRPRPAQAKSQDRTLLIDISYAAWLPQAPAGYRQVPVDTVSSRWLPQAGENFPAIPFRPGPTGTMQGPETPISQITSIQKEGFLQFKGINTPTGPTFATVTLMVRFFIYSHRFSRACESYSTQNQYCKHDNDRNMDQTATDIIEYSQNRSTAILIVCENRYSNEK